LALNENINTLEKAKFRDAGNGLSRVAVDVESSTSGPPSGSTQFVFQNGQSSVASGSEVTVAQKTFTSGGAVFGLSISGTNKARYRMYVGASLIQDVYTYFTGLSWSTSFLPYGVTVAAGEAVSITVEHTRTDSGDFSATLWGHE
jgi:hypothetical protein